MSTLLGPFRSSCLLVIFNPDDPTQVRQVADDGSPRWVSNSETALADCGIATEANGAFYFAEFPIDLSIGRTYAIAVYPADATAFTDAYELHQFEPELQVSISVIGPLTTTVTTRPRYTTAGGTIINLAHAQQSSVTYSFQILDSDGAQVDVTGNDFTFSVFDANGTILFSRTQEDGIAVAGNQVAVTVSESDSDQSTGDYQFTLRNMSQGKTIAAQGQFKIKLAPLP